MAKTRISAAYFKCAYEWLGRKIGLVRVDRLRIDEKYQRHLDNKSVQNKVDGFDPAALRTLVVAYRPDGYFYILDGQTRFTVMKDKDIQKQLHEQFGLKSTDWVSCEVHTLPNQKAEGGLFPKLNNAKAVGPIAKFKANLYCGAPNETKINDIVNRHHLVIQQGKGRPRHSDTRTRITSLGTLLSIFGTKGESVLEDTLYVLSNAFVYDNGKVMEVAVNQQWLKAVSYYLFNFGKEINAEGLVEALTGTDPLEVQKQCHAEAEGVRSDPWPIMAQWIGNKIQADRNNKRRKAA